MGINSISGYQSVDQNKNSLLLNAGLPWTNPLKIQIGSDEHILDTTINRGLMMLLNNDYYLDMKTKVMTEDLSQAIKNEDILADVLEKHVNDDSIHRKDSTYYTDSEQLHY